MEQYIGAYVNYFEDNWLDWLSLTKFVGTNNKSETTKITLFFLYKGFYPQMSLKTAKSLPSNIREENADFFLPK